MREINMYVYCIYTKTERQTKTEELVTIVSVCIYI